MQHPITDHIVESTCHVEPIHKAVDPQQLAEASLVYLLVRGMGCPACAMRVRNALLAVDGVLAVEVLLERGVARVRYDPAQVAPNDLPDALATADESARHRYTARVLEFPT